MRFCFDQNNDFLSTKSNFRYFGTCHLFHSKLGYYAAFKVRKFEWLFNKINTCLQKTATCTGLQAEQIFSAEV